MCRRPRCQKYRGRDGHGRHLGLQKRFRIDVTVSSIGDAKTLQGGVLLQVPFWARMAQYAVAQGPRRSAILRRVRRRQRH
jgi:hypothetical protein